MPYLTFVIHPDALLKLQYFRKFSEFFKNRWSQMGSNCPLILAQNPFSVKIDQRHIS